MNRTIQTAFVSCIVVSLSCNALFARGGHGGGAAPSGGSGHAASGGGGAGSGHPSAGGGAAPHISAGGGASAGGQVQSHVGGQPAIHHNPALNQTNLGGHIGISGSPQVGFHPSVTNNSRPNLSSNLATGLNSNVGLGATHHNPGVGNHIIGNNGSQISLSGNHGNHTGIAHQNFVGNHVNIGNRNVSLGGVAYRPSYYRHSDFYHGYWNGNRGYGGFGYGLGYGGYGWGPGYRYGYNPYGYRPFFWGLGGWGLGSLMYGSGYLGYSNPYYNYGVVGVGYNYSQPIPVVYNTTLVGNNPAVVTGPNSAEQIMNDAVAAFRQNDYDAALDIANRGINQHPDDAVLHEFRALVLFARGDYQQAAATVHSVLAVGPGWDWTTLSGLYSDINLYTAQLRALEASVKQNPQDGASRFLLAYHYLSDGYPDAAVRQLQQVVALVPNDQVASSLLKMTSAPQQTSTDPNDLPVPQPPVDTPVQNRNTAPPIDPDMIVGTWRASRDDGSRFSLNLANDKTFSWSFTPKGQPPQSFEGTYTIDGNVVALEREGGGSLIAEITGNNGSRFNFKLAGAPSEDPGLNFVK